MNWESVEGNWLEMKGKLRQQWGKLTDQDLESIGGAKDRLLGALKQRYGMEADKAHQEIDRWVSTLESKIKHEPR